MDFPSILRLRKNQLLSRFWESATNRNIQRYNMAVFTLPQISYFLSLQRHINVTHECHLDLTNILDPVSMEKSCPRCRGSPRKLPVAKLTFHTFPFKKQNGANHLLEKQKVGMAKRVTHQAGSSFCESRVTLVVGQTIVSK